MQGKISVYSIRKGGLKPPFCSGYNYRIDRANRTFGNPFELKNPNDPIERHEVVEKYKIWLENNIDQRRVQNELLRLTNLLKSGEDINLLCWCKRSDVEVECHGDIIKKLLEDILKDDKN